MELRCACSGCLSFYAIAYDTRNISYFRPTKLHQVRICDMILWCQVWLFTLDKNVVLKWLCVRNREMKLLLRSDKSTNKAVTKDNCQRERWRKGFVEDRRVSSSELLSLQIDLDDTKYCGVITSNDFHLAQFLFRASINPIEITNHCQGFVKVLPIFLQNFTRVLPL